MPKPKNKSKYRYFRRKLKKPSDRTHYFYGKPNRLSKLLKEQIIRNGGNVVDMEDFNN